METETRGDPAGLHAEFLQGIREGKGQVDVRVGVVVIGSVEEIVVAVDLASGDGDGDGVYIVVAGDVAAGAVGRDGRASGEYDQIGGLAAIERKVDDSLLIDHFGDGRVLCFDHGGVCGDVDLLGNAAYGEGDIDLDVLADLEDDAGLQVFAEGR